MSYESFDNSKNKLEKSWNRSQNNENELNNNSIISLNFNSVNFNKKIVTIPILENQLVPFFPLEKVQTILLENFPEWVINMIEPTIIYTMADGFVENLTSSLSHVGLDIGQVYIEQQEMRYWFNRIDNVHYFLKIFYKIRILTKIPGAPPTALVPTYANMSLKIYNQRIYETTNEKFE